MPVPIAKRRLLTWALALGLLLAAPPKVASAGEGRQAARQARHAGVQTRGKTYTRHRSVRRPTRRGVKSARWRQRFRRGSGGESRSGSKKVERLPPPPYPKNYSGPGEFARSVLRFGSGDAAARERIKTLTAKELRDGGFTLEMARTWLKFLQNEKRRVPHNPSVRGRIEFMERAIELLGGRDASRSVPVRRIWRVTSRELSGNARGPAPSR